MTLRLPDPTGPSGAEPAGSASAGGDSGRGRSPGRWLRRLWADTGPRAAVLVAVIAAATFFACRQSHRAATAADRERLRILHREVRDEAIARVEASRSGLRGFASVFAADEVISREAFRRAVTFFNLGQNLPAAKGLGLIRRVPHEQAEEFERTAKLDGADDFHLHPLPEAATSGGAHPDRLVVTYVEPRETNRGVYGLDLGNDADRRATAERAVVTGEMALTAPLTLAHTRGRGPGMLAMVPVMTRSADPLARREIAWVYASLLPQELLAGLTGTGLSEVDAAVFASDATGRSVRLVASGHADPAAASTATPGRSLDGGDRLTLRSGFSVGGRRWTLTTTPTAAFERASLWGAWLMKAAGLLSAGLTLALFRVPAMERRRGRMEARRLARVMTKDLRQAAETDPLTGLLNRAALLQEVEAAVADADTETDPAGDPRVAVLFLDFDRFKEVNDTRGHAAGDELLRRISGRILTELRSGDSAGRARRKPAGDRHGGAADRRSEAAGTPTVRGDGGNAVPARGEDAVPARCGNAVPARRGDAVPARRGNAVPARRGNAVPARLGGDEFVVLLRDLDAAAARRVAERLLRRLSKPYFLSSGGGPAISTPSIGVASASADLADAAALLAAADAAMYEAKHAGRACIRVHAAEAPAAALRLAA